MMDKKAYLKEYRKKNKERLREADKEYRLANKIILSEKRKEWYLKNRTACIEKAKEWSAANPEKRKAIMLRFEINNPGKINSNKKKYEENNKEKLKKKRHVYNTLPHVKERKNKHARTNWDNNYKKNCEKYKEWSRVASKKYSAELHPKYVRDLLKSEGFTKEDILNFPPLIPLKQVKVIIKRNNKLKTKNHEKEHYL